MDLYANQVKLDPRGNLDDHHTWLGLIEIQGVNYYIHKEVILKILDHFRPIEQPAPNEALVYNQNDVENTWGAGYSAGYRQGWRDRNENV